MRSRCVLPGQTYLVTRRCSERRFFLTPSKTVNQIVEYALAKATSAWGVSVHGWVAMSNHVHIVLTDVDGLLPSFMHAFNLEVAKAVSAEIGRWGGFWEAGVSYSAVRLLDEEAVLDKLAYTLANPVAARLVKRARQWTGSSSVGLRFGDTVVAPRPDCLYYVASTQPASYTLRLDAPPRQDPIEFASRLRDRLRERERSVQSTHVPGRPFLGTRRLARQDPYDNPTSWEKRRGLSPTYATSDRWARAEAAQRRSDWLAAYREALERFRLGVRDAVFPVGTWAMRLLGCCCEPMSG